MIQQPFFQLLRLAVGTQDCMSGPLTHDEWQETYEIAQKQSLVGIVYAVIQTLDSDICPSKEICREFLCNAEPIRKRNQILKLRCADLDKMLSEAGYIPCVLKGQSLARYYGNIACYRSSGDIDVWVDASIESIVEFINKCGYGFRATYVHVETDLFPDTHVEIHPRPAMLRCPWHDLRLQRWFRMFDNDAFDRRDGFAVAPVEFDVIYLLVHMLHHLLFEGLGLRQLVDYACLLKNSDVHHDAEGTKGIMQSIGILKFSRGVMWIMREGFGINDEFLIVEPDQEIGALLLDEIMAGGDFGKYDNRYALSRSTRRWKRAWGGIVRNVGFLKVAPTEVLCDPLWRVWHYCWRRINRYL